MVLEGWEITQSQTRALNTALFSSRNENGESDLNKIWKVFTKYSMRWRGKIKRGSHKTKRNSLGLIYSIQLYYLAKAASVLNSQSLIWFLQAISRVKYFFPFLFQERKKEVWHSWKSSLLIQHFIAMPLALWCYSSDYICTFPQHPSVLNSARFAFCSVCSFYIVY